MNAAELRFGSLLFDSAERLCIVERIESDSFYAPAIYGPITELPNKPIPLTEETLSRLGFCDKEYKDGYVGLELKSKSGIFDFVLTKPKVLGEFQKHYAWEFRMGGFPMFKEVESVHRLQNLIYSLHEKELKFVK